MLPVRASLALEGSHDICVSFISTSSSFLNITSQFLMTKDL